MFPVHGFQGAVIAGYESQIVHFARRLYARYLRCSKREASNATMDMTSKQILLLFSEGVYRRIKQPKTKMSISYPCNLTGITASSDSNLPDPI